ncbi:MAG TPA: hypothetical protein VJL81_10630 [Solirubrobacterales bacterium]|nr:hypothetical protein [Solirubrobacterales bacterium]
MKGRLLIGVCVATSALAIAPTTASACASVAGVHAFTGHAYISFLGSASGPITGSGGSESIGIDRKGATLELDLNHKLRGKGKFATTYIFSGKVWAGTISVDDAFSLSEGGSAEDTYSGNGPPAFGGASAFLDTATCRYVVAVNFGVHTTYSGDGILSAGTGVSLAAVGDRNKIPGDLHLVGGVGADGYLTCPGEPIVDGHPCVEIGGGWANDFAELKECGSFPPEGNCVTGEKPIGDGKFLWVLKPH